MVRVKFCGLSRISDIEAVNDLMPDYIGFVFWPQSKRFISPVKAQALREKLKPGIFVAGVFVDERHEVIAGLVSRGIIDVVQLHGHEDREYISRLKGLTDRPTIKAFKVSGKDDIMKAESCTADYVMLDSGMGTGKAFNWDIIRGITRPYFLAGGLDPFNVSEAVGRLSPYAVDVSSGIETDGVKDRAKMSAFIEAVRGKESNS